MAKNISQIRVVQFLFGQWRHAPIATIIMTVLSAIATISTAVIAPLLVSKLLINISNGNANLNNSLWLIIGYSALQLFGDVILYRIVIAANYISETKMVIAISSNITKHLSDKSLNYHANKMGGGLISNTEKLTGAVNSFWNTLTYDIIPMITTMIAVCITLGIILWQYAIVITILSIIITAIVIRSQIKSTPISEKASKEYSKAAAYLADIVGNISTVKTFAGEKFELRQQRKLLNNWRDQSMIEMKRVLMVSGTYGFMLTILTACALTAAVLSTEYKIANVGTVYLIISYTINVVWNLWSVSNATKQYIGVIGRATPMIEILDSPIDVKDPVEPKKLIVTSGAIKFDHVKFTHSDANQALFDDFSLSIKPGEQVGIVGKSGSGKSSLTRIMLRLSDIESGSIMIDGINIAEVSQEDLHNSIAYVSQEPSLFHRSLRDNIAYGYRDATDKEVHEAAREAHALEFIEKQPKGLDTLVGERGIKLSGGQRQRIAIARAILKDAPILVLDEATSALDSESERLIQDALVKLMKSRTSIVIAHRLSTIARLDRIIVLDNGQIAEQGTHKNLLAKNGIYAKLWAHQSGGFIEE